MSSHWISLKSQSEGGPPTDQPVYFGTRGFRSTENESLQLSCVGDGIGVAQCQDPPKRGADILDSGAKGCKGLPTVVGRGSIVQCSGEFNAMVPYWLKLAISEA
ncbi:unnamed protein product [Allacma fusca]|uniref:Uncharacterized protein n=1 Tax=Allacma fusca TaxID=39272 RepID=A0A8J2JAE9_9HEXA|nr:unnamed protein product [Allacma fusca]